MAYAIYALIIQDLYFPLYTIFKALEIMGNINKQQNISDSCVAQTYVIWNVYIILEMYYIYVYGSGVMNKNGDSNFKYSFSGYNC